MRVLPPIADLVELYYVIRRKNKLAQLARFQAACIRSYCQADQDLGWVEQVIYLETKGRQIVQREIYIKEETLEVRKAISSSPPTRASEQIKQFRLYENELWTLSRRYDEHERELRFFRDNRPIGPVQRAYFSTRTLDDFWFLSRALIDDCAARGGCCRLSSKCCEKERNTYRKLRHGHCTANCGCCIRSHVLEVERMHDSPFDFVTFPKSLGDSIVRSYVYGRQLDYK